LGGGGSAARAIAPLSLSADPSDPASRNTKEQQNAAKTSRPHWLIFLAPGHVPAIASMPPRFSGPREITNDQKKG
jgi:hypothetical protein